MNKNLSADLASLRLDRDRPPPARGWAKVAGAVLLVLGLGAAYVVGQPYVEAQLFQTQVEATEITLVSPAQASTELSASGYVQAERVSRVASKVPGRVLKVHVEQGDVVKAGALLLELDPADEKASITAAQSEVAAALAQKRSAEARALVTRAELADAKQQAERERKLATEGAGMVSVAEDLEAKVASLTQSVTAAEADAKAAEAAVHALQARAGVLTTALANLQLVAPIAGTVLNKPPQIGEYVGPQPAGVTVDMGGIRIADLSSLVVETDIPEGRLAQVKENAPTEIVLDAYPGRRLRGKVLQITPEVDRAKATVKVKVAFRDPTTFVLPDMAARVSFLREEVPADKLAEPPKAVVPSAAVTERDGAKVVFVLDQGQAHMVPVELGPALAGGFELVRGPAAGTRVVADPPEKLADGQAVKLKG